LVLSWDLRNINFVMYSSIPLSQIEKSREHRDPFPDFKKSFSIERRVVISTGENGYWPVFNELISSLRKNQSSVEITFPIDRPFFTSLAGARAPNLPPPRQFPHKMPLFLFILLKIDFMSKEGYEE